MVGWHHLRDRHELGWTPGDGEGQGSLVCSCPWGLIEFGHHWETEQPQNAVNMLESVLLLMVVVVMVTSDGDVDCGDDDGDGAGDGGGGDGDFDGGVDCGDDGDGAGDGGGGDDDF